MHTHTHFIITFLLFSMPFFSSTSMIIKDIEEPIGIAWLNQYDYVVGGKNGCKIFEYNQKGELQSTKIVTQEEVCQLAINKDRTLLALSLFNQIEKDNQALYHIDSDKLVKISECMHNFYICSAFSSTNNSLFVHTDSNVLAEYNDQGRKTKEHRFETSLEFFPYIDYHPTKKRLLCLSGEKELTIFQINDHSLDKKIYIRSYDINIESAEYTPDGNHIIIKTSNNSYFIANLNAARERDCDSQKEIEAHQLIHDNNKEYVSCAFHRTRSLIALLTGNNYIHYFNYITRDWIATQALIPNPRYSFYSARPSKRLSICPLGENLLVATRERCHIIEVPQSKLLDSYKWLIRKNSPTELKKYIFSLLLSSLHTENYDPIAFEHVQRINIKGKGKSNTIEPKEKKESTEKETIYITFIPKPNIYHELDMWHNGTVAELL